MLWVISVQASRCSSHASILEEMQKSRSNIPVSQAMHAECLQVDAYAG